MSCCCGGDAASPAVPAPSISDAQSSWRTRIVAAFQWVLPVATLALVPKCPGCVAGYVLLLTGMGISFTAAATLRWSIIGLSITALAYLAFRAGRRAFTHFAAHA